jgi:iron complex outermembrane receptor protein
MTTRTIGSALLFFALASPARGASGHLSASPEPFPREVLGAQRLAGAPQDESRVPGRVIVLTREDIRTSGARTLPELLSAQAGVNAFDSVGNSFQPTLDLRGFNASPVPATAVVVDGVRVNESDLGQVEWQLIDLETVERVEIHPGPSTLYGKNALAGVIHVTTRRGEPGLSAESGAGWGSFRRRKEWAQASGGARKFDFLVSASKEDDGGYRSNSDADVESLFVKAGYRGEEGSEAVCSLTHVDDRLRQPGSLTEEEAARDPARNVSMVDTVSRLDMLALNQRQALPGGFSISANAFLRRRREETPLNKGRSSVSRFLADMKSQGAAAQLNRDSDLFGGRNAAAAGIEISRQDSDSESSGSFGSFPFQSSSFVRDESMGLFATDAHDLIAERLVLTLGLRYDQSRIRYDDRTTPSNSGVRFFNRTNPRAGLNLNGEGWGGYLQYSEAYRIPTVDEVLMTGPFSGGALKPVKARNVELGASADLPGAARLRASVFQEDVQDDIYPVFDPALGYGSNINVDRTRRAGAEWEACAGMGRVIEARVGHAFIRSSFQSPMTLDKAPFGNTQEVRKGDRLPMAPEHRVSARLTLRPAEGWSATAQGLCVSGQTLFGDEADAEPPLPAYCTLDLGGSFERRGLRLFVKGSNVLDRRYASRGILSTDPASWSAARFVVPASGASVFAGASFRFSTAPGPGPRLISSRDRSGDGTGRPEGGPF